jgi:large subunit ribosomal protein L22
MEATSRARDIRISPRKMRLVVDLIRGRKVEDALVILQTTGKKAAPLIEKILRSAVANALHVAGDETAAPRVNVDDLVVKTAFVDGGPFLKRFRPRPMGRANRIRKRTSHVTVVVGARAQTPRSAPAAARPKADAPAPRRAPRKTQRKSQRKAPSK